MRIETCRSGVGDGRHGSNNGPAYIFKSDEHLGLPRLIGFFLRSLRKPQLYSTTQKAE